MVANNDIVVCGLVGQEKCKCERDIKVGKYMKGVKRCGHKGMWQRGKSQVGGTEILYTHRCWVSGQGTLPTQSQQWGLWQAFSKVPSETAPLEEAMEWTFTAHTQGYACTGSLGVP